MSTAPPAYQMYRNTTVGIELQHTLEEYVAQGIISESLANRMLVLFDQCFNKNISTKARNKVNFKAEKLRAYRFCDNVWTFLIDRMTFRDSIEAPKDSVKIVACDGTAKTLQAMAAAGAATAQQ